MIVGGVIVAGGIGSRFGSEIPKQFLKLHGRVILEYSIDNFSRIIRDLVVVVHSDWIGEVLKLRGRRSFDIVEGGPTRQLSVLKGLESLSHKGIDIVAIHDGVRPLFSMELLEKGINHAMEKGSAVPAVRINNTLVISGGGKSIDSYLDRDKVLELQTPQVFRFDMIYRAHMSAFDRGMTDFTDDSRLLEMQGLSADIINGEKCNIKITTRDDLELAGYYMEKDRIWKNR